MILFHRQADRGSEKVGSLLLATQTKITGTELKSRSDSKVGVELSFSTAFLVPHNVQHQFLHVVSV